MELRVRRGRRLVGFCAAARRPCLHVSGVERAPSGRQRHRGEHRSARIPRAAMVVPRLADRVHDCQFFRAARSKMSLALELRRSAWPWLGGLALLCLAMFFDALVAPAQWVLGRVDTDLPFQFLPWREFGFRELAKGNLALWNPHIFAGTPFFGGMQSALLYPPNWLFMALPLPLAVNWSIALNVWMLGAFMYLWGVQRRLQPFAAFVSAAILMFCAPYFLRVSAGHLTNLAAMAWIPLIFLSIDGWLRERRPLWCLLGTLAVAMQIFAGHPQYVYFTAMVAAGYSLLRLLEYRDGRLAAATGPAAIYAGGALLAAVQLLTGRDGGQASAAGHDRRHGAPCARGEHAAVPRAVRVASTLRPVSRRRQVHLLHRALPGLAGGMRARSAAARARRAARGDLDGLGACARAFRRAGGDPRDGLECRGCAGARKRGELCACQPLQWAGIRPGGAESRFPRAAPGQTRP